MATTEIVPSDDHKASRVEAEAIVKAEKKSFCPDCGLEFAFGVKVHAYHCAAIAEGK